MPNSSLIKPVILNIKKRGRPTKSQSGLESEVTSPQVVEKVMGSESQSLHDFANEFLLIKMRFYKMISNFDSSSILESHSSTFVLVCFF